LHRPWKDKNVAAIETRLKEEEDEILKQLNTLQFPAWQPGDLVTAEPAAVES